jgi:hypothetical protein
MLLELLIVKIELALQGILGECYRDRLKHDTEISGSDGLIIDHSLLFQCIPLHYKKP